MRGTQTIKTKVSKSIFTEKEDEGHPESLTISHYDRLIRIHAMLAMLAKDNEKALQFCIDTKFFLKKIFELSYKTLNTMEQKAA
mmetsp:Transcript_29561/g.26984  ORF Transcript_29561/g.26984 Transcript_29561/m.26984 type:complete len:84 (+) Transcript_29561:235-486(+)